MAPPGVAVTPVPIDTPAGGLVRVQDETGKLYFDSSYTRGTAACSLETKLRWKKTKTGPPPFKAPPPVPLKDSLAAMSAELCASGIPASVDESALQAAIQAVPKDKAKAAAIQNAQAGLTPAAAAIQTATQDADRAACAAIEAKLAAEP